MSTSLVSIPLVAVALGKDPLQTAIAEKQFGEATEAARKELDDLLCNGWREVASGTTMTAQGIFLCVVLFKDERKRIVIQDADAMSGNPGGLYLQPVWDENN